MVSGGSSPACDPRHAGRERWHCCHEDATGRIPAEAWILETEEENMAADLRKIECSPVCGFAVQSHDGKELIEMGIQHAK